MTQKSHVFYKLDNDDNNFSTRSSSGVHKKENHQLLKMRNIEMNIEYPDEASEL